MALYIRNPEAVKLAHEVSDATGETLTQAVWTALEERLQRLRGAKMASSTFDEIMTISARSRALPELDHRSPDAILGYDDTGACGDGD